MYLKIDGGLFKYDFIDYHGILCIPVDADAKEIRRRYLKIARRLHPDSSVVEKTSHRDRDIANMLLSKLVSPAYEKLSVERNRVEYILVLSQIGKRLAQESTEIELKIEAAKELVIAPNIIDVSYKIALAKIAEIQFTELQQTTQFIAQISELNLVYLIRFVGKLTVTTPVVKLAIHSSTLPPPPEEDSVVEQYLRRAQTLIKNKQFVIAKVELQEALKLEPKNSRPHSFMAILYMRQSQVKMARIHFDNALKLDPKDPIALECKPKVDQILASQSGTSQVKKSAYSREPQPDKSGNGGLFGGLFGGKKK
jgi:tetratricopeptide (TPR) repeat protein